MASDDVTAHHSLAQESPGSDTALLIIDMISDWQFPQADDILPRAAAIAPTIAALKRRCRERGVMVIYANDNQGRWRSDFRQVVQRSLEHRGAEITQTLLPDDDDHFLLKPKHSAFFCTPLELLLQDMKVKRLLLTGIATDQCIATTAVDARMRNYEVEAIADAVATHCEERDARMRQHFEQALRVPMPRAAEVRL